MFGYAHRVRWKPFFQIVGVTAIVLLAATPLRSQTPAGVSSVHSAGDYFMFAKAAGDGDTSDPKAYEPVCDDANDKQSDVSGSDNHIYGRIHSNADLAISGSDNWFRDTRSPNPELTYGVNDGPSPACQLQAEDTNVYASGYARNIAGSGNPSVVDGPYQIGPKGWPGNLGTFLDANGMTFGNDVTQVLSGVACDVGSLTRSGTLEISAAHNGKVVCNGQDAIKISTSGLGTAAAPFRITMISRSDRDQRLEPLPGASGARCAGLDRPAL